MTRISIILFKSNSSSESNLIFNHNDMIRHGCSPVNLLQIFRTPFSKNTPGWLLLKNFFIDNVNKKVSICGFLCLYF